MRSLFWVLVALVLVGPATASAQETEPKPPFPVTDVVVQPMPSAFDHGKAATFHGSADRTGVGFRVPELSMFRPVAITLVAANKDQPVQLAIGKTWASPDRTGVTGSDGTVTELFRTDGVAEIHVRTPDGVEGAREYGIVIWVGDEKTDYPDMPSDVKFGQPDAAKHGRATAALAPVAQAPGQAPNQPSPGSPPAAAAVEPPAPASGTSPVLWLIAGLLGVLVVFAGIALLRRKR